MILGAEHCTKLENQLLKDLRLFSNFDSEVIYVDCDLFSIAL